MNSSCMHFKLSLVGGANLDASLLLSVEAWNISHYRLESGKKEKTEEEKSPMALNS